MNNIIRKLLIKLTVVSIHIEVYHYEEWFSDKSYSEMNRSEKRAYKRWLDKRNMWDGEIVIENMERKFNSFTHGRGKRD